MIGVLWFDSDPETTKTILRNCLWIGIVETPSAEQPLAALIAVRRPRRGEELKIAINSRGAAAKKQLAEGSRLKA